MPKDVKSLEIETQPSVAYAPPRFECYPLQLITLGGTAGRGDSGATGSRAPFGAAGTFSDEDPEDPYNEKEDDWGRGF